MTKSTIFTERELKVMNKKLKGKKLSQTDSNYLYKFIRPKLREITSINAEEMLNKMEYKQKPKSIENKIKKVILASVKEVEAIVLYGSVIQNNYKDYNDVDILIVTKKKNYSKLKDRHNKIEEIKMLLKEKEINVDIQIYDKETIIVSYPRSPTLIYQLKDHKVIYGYFKVPEKIQLYNLDLKMQLDWSNLEGLSPTGNEIYKALRNVVLVRLLLNKIVDNQQLREFLNKELGKKMIEKLKKDTASKEEKKFALNFLNNICEETRKELRGDLWARKV